MYNHINEWINLEFHSTICEPWDFTSEKGENVLEGRILDVMERNNEIYLLCETSSFHYKEKLIKKVIIYNRYSKNQKFSIKNAMNSSGIIVHFMFNSSGKDINFSDIVENMSMEKLSFLIGNFHINTNNTSEMPLEK